MRQRNWILLAILYIPLAWYGGNRWGREHAFADERIFDHPAPSPEAPYDVGLYLTEKYEPILGHAGITLNGGVWRIEGLVVRPDEHIVSCEVPKNGEPAISQNLIGGGFLIKDNSITTGVKP